MAQPLLDLTDVLFDPLLMDTTLVCIRSMQTVGSNGIAVDTQTTIPFSGVVTTSGGDRLQRSSDGTRVHGNITVTTAFYLYPGQVNQDADMVTYNGRNFTVTAVDDYSAYGRGFVIATCELFPLSG